MSQKGKLSKAELFFIQEHGHLTVEEVAHELDRPVSTVAKHHQPKVAEKKPSKTSTPFMRSMGRHERNGKKVATILTKGASEIADANRKTPRISDASYIHKPLED